MPSDALGTTLPASHQRWSTRPAWFVGIYAVMLAVIVVDWVTAGVVVGIVLGVPIVMLSMQDEPWHIGAATLVALLGWMAAMLLGPTSTTPPSVFVPNRVLASLSIAASGLVALALQRRRIATERAHAEAVAAAELNGLLMSLLAHDLRAPLALASDGLAYVENATGRGQAIDLALVGDVRTRLQRSLRAIDGVLAVAHDDLAGDGTGVPRVRVRQEIEAELASFAPEAGPRGKTLVSDLEALGDAAYPVPALVLRQALGILVDNAIRYAAPGAVRVAAEVRGEELVVEVTDAGPAAPGAPRNTPSGSGLGLRLCEAMMLRVSGRLECRRDEGTSTCTIHFPMTPAPWLVRRPPGAGPPVAAGA